MAKKESGGRRKVLAAVLMALFLALCLSSGMVGFLLGRNASQSAGEVVDTILLSPGDSSSPGAERSVHYLAGRVLAPDGGPCAGASVRLGDGREDVTDQEGAFYLVDVRAGEQTLEITDSEGLLSASRVIDLRFSSEGEVSADLSGGTASFTLPEDARLLELTLTLSEEGLGVDENAVCFVTRDGQLVNFSGAALRVEGAVQAVTPTGSLLTAGGYVLLPTQQVALSPQGSQIVVEPGDEAVEGAILQEDGSVSIQQDATLLPDGQVETSDGQLVGGDGSVVLVDDEGAREILSLPDEYAPSAEAVPTEAPSPAAVSAASEASVDSPESDALPEESPSPEPTLEPTLEPTVEPSPTLGLDIFDADTCLSWNQQSFIDLFKHRGSPVAQAGAQWDGLSASDGTPIAAPGDSGYYRFQLKNAEEFEILYTVTVTEQSFHLPILYSVIDEETGYQYLHRERTGEEDPVSSEVIRIKSGATQNFRIEWEWMYEDWYNPDRDDALDTYAATQTDGIYLVSVGISAEQSPYYTGGVPGEDPRYPGKR